MAGDKTTTALNDPLTASLARLKQTLEQNKRFADTAAESFPDSFDGLQTEDVTPENFGRYVMYPTFLTRVGFYTTENDRGSQDTSWSSPNTYTTPYGTLQRWGPGLSSYEEETLLGVVGAAWQRKYTGPRGRMPINQNKSQLYVVPAGAPKNREPGADEIITTVAGETSVYQINRFLKRGLGGSSLETTMASLVRLQLNTFRSEKEGSFGYWNFFRMAGRKDRDGSLIIQFDPVFVYYVNMLNVLIDIDLRATLPERMRFLFGFLSGQLYRRQPRKEFMVSTLKTICSDTREMKYFVKDLRSAIGILCEKGWLASDSAITGTGRNVPFKALFARDLTKK